MKRILFIAVMLMSFITAAQIKVNETKTVDIYRSYNGNYRLTKFTIDSVDSYAFYFRNARYTQIVDYVYIGFNDTSEVREFFNVLIDAIDTKKEYNITVGKKDVSLTKGIGTTVMVYLSEGHCYLNKKQCLEIIESL